MWKDRRGDPSVFVGDATVEDPGSLGLIVLYFDLFGESFQLTEKAYGLNLVLPQRPVRSPSLTAASTTIQTPSIRQESKLETAYHKADRAIQDIVNLLAAA
jgi:hypothetical protein